MANTKLEWLREQRWFRFLTYTFVLVMQLTVGVLWHLCQVAKQVWYTLRKEVPDQAKAWWYHVKLLASLFKKDLNNIKPEVRWFDNKDVIHSGRLIREFKENGVKHFEVRITHDNENFTVIRYPKDRFEKDMDGVWTLLPPELELSWKSITLSS